MTGIGVAMLEKNMLLFGFAGVNECSDQLNSTDIQNAREISKSQVLVVLFILYLLAPAEFSGIDSIGYLLILGCSI